MSYSRTYQTSVRDSETVEIGYPPSEGGGTVSETVTITIPVSITIHVDTDPFDNEVESCENGVDSLTASLAAAEVAHVAMIAERAKRISGHVTSGFFGLIRSEITQQATEYRSVAEALILKLNDMRNGCVAKIDQMRADFERIAQRYTRLFEDLDSEMATRVTALDGGAFKTHRAINAGSNRITVGTLLTGATIGAAENSGTRSLLAIGLLRHHAREVLNNANDFLAADYQLTQTIRRILGQHGSRARSAVYLPVLYRHSVGSATKNEEVFIPVAGPHPSLAPR